MRNLVPRFVLERQMAGQSSGTLRTVALFADLAGFTALTEALMRQGKVGAEILAQALRFYFDPLIEAVHQGGGFITGFAGDAFTALFPETPADAPAEIAETTFLPPREAHEVAPATVLSPQEALEVAPATHFPLRDAHRLAEAALDCARRMQDFIGQHSVYSTRAGSFDFGLKIGLSWGEVRWDLFQLSATRSTFVFRGPAIDGCARSEKQARPGQTVYDAAVARCLDLQDSEPPPDDQGFQHLDWTATPSPPEPESRPAPGPWTAPGDGPEPQHRPPQGPRLAQTWPEAGPWASKGERSGAERGARADTNVLASLRASSTTPSHPILGLHPIGSAQTLPHKGPGPDQMAPGLTWPQTTPGAEQTDSGLPLPQTRPGAVQTGATASEAWEQALQRFLEPGVLEFPALGEFRYVATVFVAFEGIEDVEDWLRLVHGLAVQRGGLFCGADFGDKGSQCLIHFGAPLAHENDAWAALDFALELQSLQPPGSRIRAGVTYGLRYAGFNGGHTRQEFACLGRATNLASRLMMAAPWGEIWCGPSVVARVESLFAWADRGAQPLKGFEQPVPVRCVQGRLNGPRRKSRRMVGRELQLRTLEQWLEPLFQGRFAGVYTLHGEAGQGKTLLAETLQARLEEQRGTEALLWIRAPSDPTFRWAWGAFAQALGEVFGQPSGARGGDRTGFQARLQTLIESVEGPEPALAAELKRLESVLGALIGLRFENGLYETLDPRLRYENTLIALRTWLRAESLRHPVLLHLEDAQNLDAESQETVTQLCRLASDRPVAVLICSRPNDDGSLVQWPLPGNPQSMVLQALGRADLQVLLEAQSSVPPTPELLAFVERWSGGSPFFAEQLVAHLLEQGQLATTERGLEPPDTEIQLPSDVHALLIARLDRLALEVKAAVQAASVLGQEFEVRALSRMLQAPEQTLHWVNEAERSGIWGLLAEFHYLFRHTLLRDAAYQMQTQARLKGLHQAAAEALEALFPPPREELQDVLGHHWEHAEAPDRARPCYLAAARRAQGRAALEEAERGYRNYLRLVTRESAESLQVQLDLAWQALQPRGKQDAARSLYQEVQARAQALGNPALESAALAFLGNLNREQGRLDEAWQCYESAGRLLESSADGALQARLAIHRGNLFFQQGKLAEARSRYTEALAAYRTLQDRRGEGISLLNLGNLDREQGRLAEALEPYQQALERFQAGNHRRDQAGTLGNLALLHREQGRLETAQGLYREALDLHQAMGNRRDEGIALEGLGLVSMDQGRLDEARLLYERGLAVAREASQPLLECGLLRKLGSLDTQAGRLESAQTHAEDALQLSRRLGSRRNEGLCLTTISEVYRLQGRQAEARTCLQQAEALLEQLQDRLQLAFVRISRGHLALAENQGAQELIQGAGLLIQSVGASPESAIGKSFQELQQAQAAFETDGQARLFRGQLLDNLTAGQLRWISEQGHRPAIV